MIFNVESQYWFNHKLHSLKTAHNLSWLLKLFSWPILWTFCTQLSSPILYLFSFCSVSKLSGVLCGSNCVSHFGFFVVWLQPLWWEDWCESCCEEKVESCHWRKDWWCLHKATQAHKADKTFPVFNFVVCSCSNTVACHFVQPDPTFKRCKID